MGGLDAYRLRYVDDGDGPDDLSVGVSDAFSARLGAKKKRQRKKRFKEPRDVVEYKLVQVDGIASIRCSAPEGEGKRHARVFEQVRAAFVLDATRRW